MFPCPACGKATRVMHDDRMRICSICRKVSKAVDCTPENAPKPKKKSGVDDAVGTMDQSYGWLEKDPAPPVFPCKSCGRETKAHHDGGRICKPCNFTQ